MAVSAGKDAQFHIAEAGQSTLTDMTSYLTSVSGPGVDAQTAEVSTLGDDWKSYIRTQVDPGAISVEGIYETAAGTILHALGTADPHAFKLFPQGSATGNSVISGSVLLTSYEPGNDRDDASLFSAAFQITGTLTHGVVA